MIPSLEDILAMAQSMEPDHAELRKAIVIFVDGHPREDSVVLFYKLDEIDNALSESDYGLIDILDSLCGYCGLHSRIGTADYNFLA